MATKKQPSAQAMGRAVKASEENLEAKGKRLSKEMNEKMAAADSKMRKLNAKADVKRNQANGLLKGNTDKRRTTSKMKKGK